MLLNSSNEWGKLREVIVGDPTNTVFPKTTESVDLSFRLFYHDNLYEDNNEIKVKKSTNYQDICFVSKQIQEERLEDIKVFIFTLENLGITVYRPNQTKLGIVANNYWSTANSPAGTVRDQVLIYKNNIVETSPQVRCRYFENEALYDIFYEKFNKGCNWYQMPKSRMRDENFDKSYICKAFESNINGLYEIMFDGAQCLRFNDKILVNCSTKNHDLGYEWLNRLFPNTLYKVRFTDSHLDGTLMPIDDGVMIAGPKFYKKYTKEDLPLWLQNWDIICLDDYDYSDAQYMRLASETIFVNCLSLGDKTVIINSCAKNLRKKLESRGFTVIPLNMRHDRIYGGSFHCITLDLVRDN